MMLYKLSISNIKKSFKDYAIYFITLILGVCIFYLFNSMDSQTANIAFSSNQNEMIQLLVELLSYVSIFVSLILGFLIIYASRFLIKKRNKEFGIYMTLGMSKRKISTLLLIETFIIGLISLIVGLGLGVVLSQVTSIFVANMFEADMSKYTFTFSSSALLKTIMYFGIIYFVVMIFNTFIINKNKLINLLQANRKQEKIKIKNPIISIILFIISICLLGYAYYLVTDGFGDFFNGKEVSMMLLPISMGMVGTVLFYYSVAGMFLKLISKIKNTYYKGLNTFIYKQISSKINTMVISISFICIMLFFTLCLLSSAFTIKEYFNKSLNTLCPVDYELVEFEVNTNSILDDLDINSIVDSKDVLKVYEYYDINFTGEASLGTENINYLKEYYPYINYEDSLVEIMKISDYNKMAKLLDLEEINLKLNEYAIINNYEKNIYQGSLDFNNEIDIFGNHLIKGYDKVIEGFNKVGGTASNIGFFVVNDDIISNDYLSRNVLLFGNYNTSDDSIKLDNDKKLENVFNDYKSITLDTKNNVKENSSGLTAIVTFIGLYLGIIFLISSAAILSLKELSDSLDDRNKYRMLRQIGAEEKEINSALFKQSLLFFIMPLSLAIIHTIFGLKFCQFILSSLGITSMTKGFIETLIFLIIIYGIYFIITYLCSKNIIKERINNNY